MVYKHELGTSFYINSVVATEPKNRGGNGPRTLVVHAHGAQSIVERNPTAIPGNITVLFQVSDWNYANNGALAQHLRYLVRNDQFSNDAVDETALNGVLKDYEIWKYQSAGTAGYQEVAALVDLNTARTATFDVVTPRNRLTWGRNKIPVYFSQLFAQLNLIRDAHGYTQIYCSFCRVLKENPSYRPARNVIDWSTEL